MSFDNNLVLLVIPPVLILAIFIVHRFTKPR